MGIGIGFSFRGEVPDWVGKAVLVQRIGRAYIGNAGKKGRKRVDSTGCFLFVMAERERTYPGSVQRHEQISVENEKQDQVDRNAENTGELQGEA